MPYVNIKITREGATADQKAQLIQGATDLLVRVLAKDPTTTVVVIDEVLIEDWGIGGVPVDEYRQRTQNFAPMSAPTKSAGELADGGTTEV